MSSEWMSKLHSFVPLTEQEEEVQDLLNLRSIPNSPHKVFPVGHRLYVGDFYLPLQNLLIECWKVDSKRGNALVWIEKNACYVDWKFKRIKKTNSTLRCVVLVQARQADPGTVRRYAKPPLKHADEICCSMEELADVLDSVCRFQ